MILGINRRLAVTAIAGALGGLLFGYDIGAISSATPGLRACFGLSPSALGLAVSAALFGTIAGSLAAGMAGDVVDRRTTLLVSALLYATGSAGAALAVGFHYFIIFRVLCGAAIGLISVIAPMYLAEISPARLRGRIVGMFQWALSLGVVLAFVLSFVLSLHAHVERAWRYGLGIAFVPAIICTALLLFASPSPRWLTLEGRVAEARSALAALGDGSGVMGGQHEMRSDNCAVTSRLFSRCYLRPILLAISIAVFNQLTGVNVLLYYILDIFNDVGAGHLHGRADAVFVSTMSLIVTAIAVSVIDRVGRKPLLLVGAVGMGICLAALAEIHHMHWPPSTVVWVVICYNAFFAFSQGTVIWVMLSELFPIPVRAKGQSLGGTAHWIANALITGTFPMIVSRLGTKVFSVFALIMVVQFFAILLFYPETKQTTLESLASSES
jgi:SP family arabinose:H+ symporter-like MFS transporter